MNTIAIVGRRDRGLSAEVFELVPDRDALSVAFDAAQPGGDLNAARAIVATMIAPHQCGFTGCRCPEMRDVLIGDAVVRFLRRYPLGVFIIEPDDQGRRHVPTPWLLRGGDGWAPSIMGTERFANEPF